ncbi:unnamed protein product, partial [marine sediment metagenome]
VFTGDLLDSHFPNGYFDVVTLWATFAHLHAPQETLLEINRILRKDGLVVILTSNTESFEPKLFRLLSIKRPTTFDVPRHLYHFQVPFWIEQKVKLQHL